ALADRWSLLRRSTTAQWSGCRDRRVLGGAPAKLPGAGGCCSLPLAGIQRNRTGRAGRYSAQEFLVFLSRRGRILSVCRLVSRGLGARGAARGASDRVVAMKRVPIRSASLTLTLTLAQWPSPVLAQQLFPARPVRIISPYAPGGGNDVLCRIVAHRLA